MYSVYSVYSVCVCVSQAQHRETSRFVRSLFSLGASLQVACAAPTESLLQGSLQYECKLFACKQPEPAQNEDRTKAHTKVCNGPCMETAVNHLQCYISNLSNGSSGGSSSNGNEHSPLALVHMGREQRNVQPPELACVVPLRLEVKRDAALQDLTLHCGYKQHQHQHQQNERPAGGGDYGQQEGSDDSRAAWDREAGHGFEQKLLDISLQAVVEARKAQELSEQVRLQLSGVYDALHKLQFAQATALLRHLLGEVERSSGFPTLGIQNAHEAHFPSTTITTTSRSRSSGGAHLEQTRGVLFQLWTTLKLLLLDALAEAGRFRDLDAESTFTLTALDTLAPGASGFAGLSRLRERLFAWQAIVAEMLPLQEVALHDFQQQEGSACTNELLSNLDTLLQVRACVCVCECVSVSE